MRKVVVKAKPAVPRDYAKALYGSTAPKQPAPKTEPGNRIYGAK